MLYGVAIATVPDPGGPTEHKGEKHLFAVDTLSVEDDSEKCTRGVHMCGWQKGSFGFPHLGQMRSARIESPSLASDPSASHGAPWSPSTWHIWEAPPTSLPPMVKLKANNLSPHSPWLQGLGVGFTPLLVNSRDGKMWGPVEISVCPPPHSHLGQHMPSCSGHPAQIKVHREIKSHHAPSWQEWRCRQTAF